MTAVLSRFRQPAYTGENRCMPCTAVNVFIAFLLALATLAALVLTGYQSAGVVLGNAVFLVSLVLIYLRGYLVPGTPTLTKRYFPAWLLDVFGKQPAEGLTGGASTAAAGDAGDDELTGQDVEPEEWLLAADALQPVAGGDDLEFTPDFRDAWTDEMAAVVAEDADRERLLAVLDAEDLDPTFEEFGDAFAARVDGVRIGTWESRAAFVADVAAAPLLAERIDDWDRLSVYAAGQLLTGLRLFLEACPTCGGEVSFATDTVESCCSTHQVAAVSCEACGARLFESDPL